VGAPWDGTEAGFGGDVGGVGSWGGLGADELIRRQPSGFFFYSDLRLHERSVFFFPEGRD
jgi:hypothetical protein